MTTTPENGAADQTPAADQHAQTQPTQPLPVNPTQPLPVNATQPLPVHPRPAHPTNPFLPPHPAAPADQRAAYEAAQRQAAAQQPAQQQASQMDQFEAVRRAQWEAAQRAAAQDPATAPQAAYQPAAAYAGGPAPQGPVPPQRKRSLWLPVTSAAAAAAIVAAIATVGITQVLSDDDVAGNRPASLATIGQSANDTVPVAGSTSEDPDWQAVSQAVQQSVVAIQVSTGNGGGAEGSGVIIDDAGHIVTNNHVVAGADGEVQVTLTDGRLFDATIVGTDATTDLAVIKLKDAPDDLTSAALGDSSKVVVGQPVMAVGNPLGLANTVTTGIVSAVDRPVSTSGDSTSEATVTNAIQIDAAVNPGNSGGPLFDAQGRVIGINSSIATLSSESGSIGLGFAIPVDLVKNIAAQLIDDGTAEHAFLGVSLSDGTATADGVTRRGAVVEQVTDGSPAAKAELQAKDAIVAIDGDAVGGAESLTAYVRALPSGTDVTLTVVRDGKTIEVDVTLAVRPETAQSEPQQQAPDEQEAPDDQPGQNGFPEGMTPDELWEWFQQQQGQQGQG
ncbi:trypsin-like peptidase domain-containing protein [Cellulomonas sp. Root137]|uniref:trypsin-like peptidase domain-containing protein n=1 Tax=Cellulomonas sp. Root137 TaxID=1736459 RepID=UPI0006FEC2C1|nr:trypsin-like peptidase domain-containing protein [Cellulomonas sp. Root137]KQY47168.1 peptidase S1 [Cellulomonas sp. Root137]